MTHMTPRFGAGAPARWLGPLLRSQGAEVRWQPCGSLIRGLAGGELASTLAQVGTVQALPPVGMWLQFFAGCWLTGRVTALCDADMHTVLDTHLIMSSWSEASQPPPTFRGGGHTKVWAPGCEGHGTTPAPACHTLSSGSYHPVV